LGPPGLYGPPYPPPPLFIPPPTYTDPPSYSAPLYSGYDPINIQYTPLSISAWQSIPNDPSEYSHYWDSRECFDPQQFAENTRVASSWHDVGWALAFLLNLVVIAAVFYFAWRAQAIRTNFRSGDENNSTAIYNCLAIGLVMGLAINIVHSFYCTCAPLFYIKFGFFATIIISVLLVVYCFMVGMLGFVLFPIIVAVFSCLMWYICRRFFELSAAIMRQACRVVFKYPSILLLCFFESLLEIGLSVVFSLMAFAIDEAGWSNWAYLYGLFAYLWVTLTLSYVVYWTMAGLVASWYFLNDTGYFPGCPVGHSLKRASTTSFGSACIAGFLLAII
jgi:hypothetical protein